MKKTINIDGVEYNLTPVEKKVIIEKTFHFELHSETKKLNWYEAVDYCKSLGDGWRLPTILELHLIHDAKVIKEDIYWSSSEYTNTNAWYFYFYFGSASYSNKSNTFYVLSLIHI